jgi:hypothetical protein
VTIGRIYLWALTACAAASCALAGLTALSRKELLLLCVLNGIGFLPLVAVGGLMLGLRVSRPTMVFTMAAGWLGGCGGLIASAVGNVPLMRTELIGPAVPPVLGAGGCLLMTAVGLLVGSHVEPGVPPPHVCQRCGYDRRGLTSGAPCPECGA